MTHKMEESKSTVQEREIPLCKSKQLLRTVLFEYVLHVTVVSLLFLMSVVFVAFFLPISLIFRIYRTVLIHKIQKKYHGKAAMVSGDDAVWLQDSPKNRAIINSIMQMQGKPDVVKFRNKLMESMVSNKQNGELRFPKLTSYPTRIMSRFVWIKDEKFDIQDHVIMYDGPTPKSAKELTACIGEIISEDLPEKKPAWQFIMIPPISEMADENYHIVMRVHHSIADGVSLIKVVMENVIDKTPKYLTPPRFGTTGKVLRAVKGLFLGPYILMRTMLMPSEPHCLHKNSMSGQKLVAWSNAIDLELIKKIKNATEATVNDVLMSCLAGTFRDYLTKFSSNMPKEVIASIPVDTRSPAAQPVLDNHFSLILMKLPVHVDDSLERLEEVKRRMNEMKSSPEALVNALLIKYCMARLPKWCTHMIFDWLSDKCCLVLSNLPGPQQELSISGDKVVDMTFWPPQRKNIGMGISIFSYNGHVRMGIAMDKVVMSNPGIMTEKFEEQVYELANRLKLE